MGSFRIHIAKDYLGFSSGHFITFDGHQCETLHGHNYKVRVAIEGPVDENSYVLDFVRVKRIMKTICDGLDHRMLLAQHNTLIEIEEHEDSVSARYKHRRFLFPREDVVLLPIPNTTAEMLAQYIAGLAIQEIRKIQAAPLRSIEVEVEEAVGQFASYREEFPAA